MKAGKERLKVYRAVRSGRSGARYSREKLVSLSRGTGISPEETLALVKKYMPESLRELEE